MAESPNLPSWAMHLHVLQLRITTTTASASSPSPPRLFQQSMLLFALGFAQPHQVFLLLFAITTPLPLKPAGTSTRES